MTSPLTTSNAALVNSLVTKLTNAGYPWNKQTTSFDRYLGNVLAGLSGGTPWLTQSRSKMLANILTALGGSGNRLTMSEVTLMTDIIDSTGGGGGYHASAVHFNGTASLQNASLVVTDSSVFSCSFWYNVADFGGSSGRAVGTSDPSGNDDNLIYFSNGSTSESVPAIFLKDNVGGVAKAGISGSADTTAGVWHSVVASLDFSYAGGGPLLAKIYIDDVDATTVTDDGGAAFTAVLNGLAYWIGNDAFANADAYIGDFADLRIAPGQSWLNESGDIPLATRRLFVDGSGKPVNPATATASLGAPCMLFSGASAAFTTNQGTGGAFTLVGSLTNAGTSPSD